MGLTSNLEGTATVIEQFNPSRQSADRNSVRSTLP